MLVTLGGLSAALLAGVMPARADDDERAGLQPRQELVEVEVAGRCAGDGIAPLVEVLEAIEVLARAGLDPNLEPRRVGPAPPRLELGGAGPTLHESSRWRYLGAGHVDRGEGAAPTKNVGWGPAPPFLIKICNVKQVW